MIFALVNGPLQINENASIYYDLYLNLLGLFESRFQVGDWKGRSRQILLHCKICWDYASTIDTEARHLTHPQKIYYSSPIPQIFANVNIFPTIIKSSENTALDTGGDRISNVQDRGIVCNSDFIGQGGVQSDKWGK